MVNVFLIRLIGKFPGQTEILKGKSRLPGWDVPNGNSFTIYKFLEFRTSFMLKLEFSLGKREWSFSLGLGRRDNPEILSKR